MSFILTNGLLRFHFWRRKGGWTGIFKIWGWLQRTENQALVISLHFECLQRGIRYVATEYGLQINELFVISQNNIRNGVTEYPFQKSVS